MKTTWADIAKAKRLLDWEPLVSLEEGIRKTVEWHQANRAWLDDIRPLGNDNKNGTMISRATPGSHRQQ